MAQVFICYSRKDRDFAEVVQAKLERAGHSTVMDFDILNAGDWWQNMLDDAIRSAHAVVVVLTPEARQSEHVAYEWAFALGTRASVIPLELKPTESPPRLDALERLDFRDGARPWDTLLSEVRQAEARRPRAGIEIDAGAPLAVRQAVQAVDSLHSRERISALNTLAQTEHPVAREALARGLDHPVREVRIEAARLLPDTADPRIVPVLIEALPRLPRTDGDWLLHDEFADRMAAVGRPAVAPLLEALGRVRDVYPRSTLIAGLGRIGYPGVVPFLTRVLRDPSDACRAAAAAALGRLADPEAGEALQAALADEDDHLRRTAAESLGTLKVAAAVPALIAMLEEDGRSGRRTAARALGEIGVRSAASALTRALEDEEGQVRVAAAEALGGLGDPAPAPRLRQLLAESEPGQISELDLAVMTALARLGDDESFALLEAKLIAARSGYLGIEDMLDALVPRGEAAVGLLIRVLHGAASPGIQRGVADALRRVDTAEVRADLRRWRRRQGD
jgi:HEAT repeat protein